ncbi:MAG: hypothetical protein KatS3mg077_3081 [Candidatus Binatia bacterium]|nr:MAG: hypothetical protein KatS3mg077_3081 [Candidatus Binatia bacterium]
MHIVVCVKQVPSVAALKFNQATKTVQREGVPLEINSFDARALVWATEFKKSRPGITVTALSVGPPQAREALVEALALGADRAVLVTDPALRGSDTLATARALAGYFRKERADLILCGRYSVDAETSQVGPELAELLAIPHVSMVQKIQPAGIQPLRFELERETDLGWESLQVGTPVLLAVTEGIAPERFPSKTERAEAEGREIIILSAGDLSLSPQDVGFEGSPTRVLELTEVPSNRRQLVVSETSLEHSVKLLVEILVREYGAFENWNIQEVRGFAPELPRPVTTDPKDVIVVGEVRNGQIAPVTWELCGKARELAHAMNGELHLVLCDVTVPVPEDALKKYGVRRATVITGPACASYLPWEHAARLTELISHYRPRFVLGPSTTYGRDVLPRIAARLGLGLTADCIDLGLDPMGALLQYKPVFGGSIVAVISSRTLPEMATIRPGVFPLEPTIPQAGEQAILTVQDAGPHRFGFDVQRIGGAILPDLGADLDRAAIVVGVGKGVGREGIPAVRSFAQRLGAALCTTRDVADEGWLPRQLQVGLTGRSIAPKLYLAFGIRGAFEHMVGVRRAGVVVAVNRNPRAPVFRHSDLGVVGDIHAVLPLLDAAIREHLPRNRGS